MSNPKLNAAPQLKTLPPTNEAFEEHVYRAHLQTAIWKAVLEADPPSLNPVNYGWSLDRTTGILVPVTLPIGVSPAPLDVLKMIKCGCSPLRPCASSAAQLSCSMFCGCHGNNDCQNDRTRTARVKADEEDPEDE